MTAFYSLKRLFGLAGGNGNGGEPSGAMIDCDEAAARLFEYLDGELDDVSEEEVRRHHEVCKACYPRAQFERHFIEALERWACFRRAKGTRTPSFGGGGRLGRLIPLHPATS